MCGALGISVGDNRTVTINNFMTNVPAMTSTANASTVSTATSNTPSTSTPDNPVFTGADINWGDGNITTAVTDVVNQTHQFQSDGTFTINVMAHFNVNGQDVTANGATCQQQVSFNTSAPTVSAPTPTTPQATQTSTPAPAAQTSTPASAQTLVNTGAGNVIGVFSVATTVGTLGYRFLLTRRLSQG
jgi:hypothetical protein